MKKTILLFTVSIILITGCTKEPVRPITTQGKPPQFQAPVVNESEILAIITSLEVPRVLKIDNQMIITVKGYFDKPGYAISKVVTNRDETIYEIKIYGKPAQSSDSKFQKVITFPPQPPGEYNIVVYGKNDRFVDYVWVEEYQGRDKVKYLQRLREATNRS